MKVLLPLLLLLPLLGHSTHAEINFVTLKHRNAESLIPLLQPVLDEGVRISGQGATLIVNSKSWQLEELRPLIEQLDTPLQSLMISVIQGGDDKHSALHGDVSGTLERPGVRVYGTEKKERSAVSQQLRVLEGEWATISAGESVPVAKQTTSQSLHGTITQQSIEYKEVESGFEVRPRISGNMVTLEVRPFRAKRAAGSGGIIEQQQINTTVSGRLGEWISIGGIEQQQQQSGVGTIYANKKKRSATHNVKLRVERLSN
jgi:type II secretory pathway component GspD/PulD (secretin)